MQSMPDVLMINYFIRALSSRSAFVCLRMELIAALPRPKHEARPARPRQEEPAATAAARSFEPPAYGEREGFIPKHDSDFGDGGAFPEIHIFQVIPAELRISYLF